MTRRERMREVERRARRPAVLMSVPGRRDDGSDTWWYVVPPTSARIHVLKGAKEIGRGDVARRKAIREVDRMNRLR